MSRAKKTVTVHPPRPWKGRQGECGEAVRGVDWRRAGQPLSAMGGIHGSATMRRWSAPSGLTPFFITVAR